MCSVYRIKVKQKMGNEIHCNAHNYPMKNISITEATNFSSYIQHPTSYIYKSPPLNLVHIVWRQVDGFVYREESLST